VKASGLLHSGELFLTPRFRYAAIAICAIHGPVKFVGLNAGRIPWPKCRTGKRSRAIILDGRLAENP